MSKTPLTANELLRRFDAAGGRVYHFKGRHRCYVTTERRGSMRFHTYRRAGNVLVNGSELRDYLTERIFVKTWNEAQRIMIARAKAMPAVTPTMAMLGEMLDAMDGHTLSRDDLQWHVSQWMQLIEWKCLAPEAHDARRYIDRYGFDDALRLFAPHYLESV